MGPFNIITDESAQLKIVFDEFIRMEKQLFLFKANFISSFNLWFMFMRCCFVVIHLVQSSDALFVIAHVGKIPHSNRHDFLTEIINFSNSLPVH